MGGWEGRKQRRQHSQEGFLQEKAQRPQRSGRAWLGWGEVVREDIPEIRTRASYLESGM